MTDLQLKYGSESGWSQANPTLKKGEIGLVEHNQAILPGWNIKIGTGSDSWNDLPFFNGNLQYITNESGQQLNLNTITDPGDYILQYTGSPSLITNKPSALNSPSVWPAKLKVKKINNTSLLQEIYAIMQGATPSYLCYQRCTKNGSSWSSWAVISGSSYDITSINSKINTINSTLNNFEWGQVGTDAGSQPYYSIQGSGNTNLDLYYFKNNKIVTVYGNFPVSANNIRSIDIYNMCPYPPNASSAFIFGSNVYALLDNSLSPIRIRIIATWNGTVWTPASEGYTLMLSGALIYFTYLTDS